MNLGFDKNLISKSFDGSSFNQPLNYKPFKIRDLGEFGEFDIVPRGSCNSYILACCDKKSISVDMSQFNLITSFNEKNGQLTAQSGILVSTLINFLQDKGFLFPVVQGNPYASLGGIVAANIHGKNCYRKSVIYDHIISLKIILRSSEIIECLPGEPLFEATVGGYGITGIIYEVTISCQKSKYNSVKLTNYKVANLKEAGILIRSLTNHDYLYSFHNSSDPILNSSGVIIAADYSLIEKPSKKQKISRILDNDNPSLNNPFLKINRFSPTLWNKFTISLAQSIYFLKIQQNQNKIISLFDFYFPLDQFKTYFSFFGKKGLIETQTLIPISSWETYCDEFLNIIHKFNLRPTVLSLKLFKSKSRLISFSGEGISLTADFSYSEKALKALSLLDQINCNFGVKSNIIKDRRLKSDIVDRQYEVKTFRKYIDVCENKIYGPNLFKPCKSLLLRRILNNY